MWPCTLHLRSIGVSNFTVEQLREIVDAANVKPAVNQVGASFILPST